MCPAPKNNKFWLARSSHGRKPIFKTPSKLWKACLEYFEWVEENPLIEQRAAQFQGVFVYGDVKKMRAMTISGLCIFLDIGTSTWSDYERKEDFTDITKRVVEIIRDQKFAGASADLLNANIIARDLGLADKKDHNISSSINAEDLTDDELANIASRSSKGNNQKA